MRSRRDLRRINALMGNARIIAAVLGRTGARACASPTSAAATARLMRARGAHISRRESNVTIVDRIAGPRRASSSCAAPGKRSTPSSANLFLHHLDDATCATCLRSPRSARRSSSPASRAARARAAGEPLLWVLGCNEVTRHDAVVSVRAGFTGKRAVGGVAAAAAGSSSERAALALQPLFVARAMERLTPDHRRRARPERPRRCCSRAPAAPSRCWRRPAFRAARCAASSSPPPASNSCAGWASAPSWKRAPGPRCAPSRCGRASALSRRACRRGMPRRPGRARWCARRSIPCCSTAPVGTVPTSSGSPIRPSKRACASTRAAPGTRARGERPARLQGAFSRRRAALGDDRAHPVPRRLRRPGGKRRRPRHPRLLRAALEPRGAALARHAARRQLAGAPAGALGRVRARLPRRHARGRLARRRAVAARRAVALPRRCLRHRQRRRRSASHRRRRHCDGDAIGGAALRPVERGAEVDP